MLGKQLTFELNPVEPHSMRYFVPHSGVSEAYQTLSYLFAEPNADQERFAFFYLTGPAGTGKSHLIHGVAAELLRLGWPKEKIVIADPIDPSGEPSEEYVSQFIARYEERRSRGGVVLCASRKMPQDVSGNPHLRSRLLAGNVIELAYPQEEELAPLIESLLERNNLTLSEKSISFLLRRLPKDPLSLETILAKISELSFSEGKPARFGVVRNVVKGIVDNATARVNEGSLFHEKHEVVGADIDEQQAKKALKTEL